MHGKRVLKGGAGNRGGMHIITIGNNGEIKLGHKLVHNYLISELFSEGPAEVVTSAGKQTRNKWFPSKHATHMRIAFV